MSVEIRVYCDARLKNRAGHAADEAGLPLSELVVRALAQYLGCPELAKVPRKSIGRPRIEAAETN